MTSKLDYLRPSIKDVLLSGGDNLMQSSIREVSMLKSMGLEYESGDEWEWKE